MRWSFLFPEAREIMVDWKESWAVPFLAQIRTAHARHPENQQLGNSSKTSSKAARRPRNWERHDFYEHPDGDVRKMRLPHGRGKEVSVKILALAPLRNASLRFVAFMEIDVS